MAFMRKRGKKFYGIYHDSEGIRREVSLSSDKEAARQILANLARKIALQKAGIIDPFEEHKKRPLGKHVEDFAEFLRAKGNTEKHTRLTLADLRECVKACKFTFLSDLSASRVQAHLQRRKEQGLSLRTLNRKLVAIKSFARWLMKDRRLQETPLAHLSGWNVNLDRRLERRALSLEEAKALIEFTKQSKRSFRGLKGESRAMLYSLALGTGFRVSELASLVRESFSLEDNTPTVTCAASYSKNRKEAVQPLPLSLIPSLNEWLDRQPMSKKLWPGTWTEKAAEMIALDAKATREDCIRRLGSVKDDFLAIVNTDGQKLDFHALRHSYVTWIVKSGCNVRNAQMLARHSDVKLTLGVYSHVGLHDLASAVDQLPNFSMEHKIEYQRATGTDVNTCTKTSHNFATILPQKPDTDCTQLHLSDTPVTYLCHNDESPKNTGNRDDLQAMGAKGLEPLTYGLKVRCSAS